MQKPRLFDRAGDGIMLSIHETALVIIDLQEKLVRAMSDKDALVAKAAQLIEGAKIFGIPIVVTEQNPEKLGPTVPDLAKLLEDFQPIPKLAFSCAREPLFMNTLEQTKPKSILIAGVEAHVCVYQTCLDLVHRQYAVELVTDAISSRTAHDRDTVVKKCAMCGVLPTTVETALFELLGKAEGAAFKAVSRLVK
jgi:nicotinamidase-related amidase